MIWTKKLLQYPKIEANCVFISAIPTTEPLIAGGASSARYCNVQFVNAKLRDILRLTIETTIVVNPSATPVMALPPYMSFKLPLENVC